jgi:lysyl-tRNA synthetase class 2
MTSSAPLKNGQSEITERSELIIAGLELSDGFPWHTSADKQREGFQNALKLRKELKKEAVKIDEKYIGALSDGMPPGAGMALGIDRLVMILTGASNIKDVLAFSWDEV